MARIRTIKPEFFTSEDIVSLSPMARLLYIATWCEADREGRLVWKPKTFKLRYLPADNCDPDALADELVQAKLVVPYGAGLAFIPSFTRHQHLNPRESASALPSPEELTRGHASARVKSRIDAQGGREGKGKEGEEEPNGSSAPIAERRQGPDEFLGDSNLETMNCRGIAAIGAAWELPDAWGKDAEALGWKPAMILKQAELFRQYWTVGRGQGTRRSVKGWRQSWSNWLSKAERMAR